MYCPFIARCGKVVRDRGAARFPRTTEGGKKCQWNRGTVGQLITEGCYGIQTKADSVSHSSEMGSSSGKYPLKKEFKNIQSQRRTKKNSQKVQTCCFCYYHFSLRQTALAGRKGISLSKSAPCVTTSASTDLD